MKIKNYLESVWYCFQAKSFCLFASIPPSCGTKIVRWCQIWRMGDQCKARATKAGGVAVLPQRCAPLSPGLIPGPGAVRAFSFQSILVSAGFSPGSPVFLLHLKPRFLNKSISGITWSYSASADWQLIWHCALSPSGEMLRLIKIQIYLFYLYSQPL